MTARRLKTILASYLRGEAGWRAAIAWNRRAVGNRDELSLLMAAVDQVRALRAGRAWEAAPGELSPIVILAAMGVAAAFVLALFVLPSMQGALSQLPRPFNTYAAQVLFLAALVPVLISAVIVRGKLARIRRAAGWSGTTGTVRISEIRPDRSGSTIRNPLFDNLPHVVYEYRVGSRTYSGERISFGDDTGGANAAATLRRYPVGATVPVYYDPADPGEAILEREAPMGLVADAGRLVLWLFAGVTVLAVLAASAPAWIAAHFPHVADPRLVALTGAMALAALLVAAASWRRMRRAAGWPVVPGTVTFSAVEETSVGFDDGTQSRRRRMYRPSVEYEYGVGGQTYTGRQLRLGIDSAGAQAWAEGVVARYPVGAVVEVRHDPGNAGTAFVEAPGAIALLPLVLGLALLAATVWLAGAP